MFPYRNHPLAILQVHLAGLTPEQLTWTPPGSQNSIGWLLEHLIGTEDFWIHHLAYGGSVARPVPVDDGQALLAEYARVRAATDERLAAATPEEMARVVEVPAFSDGWSPPCTPTVHWVFHHLFEHEMYHIGQISLLLRQQGLRPLPF